LSSDEEKWLELLDPALEMFAELERTRGPVDFTLGGASVFFPLRRIE
jgi:hypothetical protein